VLSVRREAILFVGGSSGRPWMEVIAQKPRIARRQATSRELLLKLDTEIIRAHSDDLQ
jgi:hypothetical protein